MALFISAPSFAQFNNWIERIMLSSNSHHTWNSIVCALSWLWLIHVDYHFYVSFHIDAKHWHVGCQTSVAKLQLLLNRRDDWRMYNTLKSCVQKWCGSGCAKNKFSCDFQQINGLCDDICIHSCLLTTHNCCQFFKITPTFNHHVACIKIETKSLKSGA